MRRLRKAWFAERGPNHCIAGSRERSDTESGKPACPGTFLLLNLKIPCSRNSLGPGQTRLVGHLTPMTWKELCSPCYNQPSRGFPNSPSGPVPPSLMNPLWLPSTHHTRFKLTPHGGGGGPTLASYHHLIHRSPTRNHFK